MSANTLATLRTVRDAAVRGSLSAAQVELLRTVHGARYEALLASRLDSAGSSPRLNLVQALITRGAESYPLREDARPRVLIGELRERLAMTWMAEDAFLIVREAEAQRALADREARRAARR